MNTSRRPLWILLLCWAFWACDDVLSGEDAGSRGRAFDRGRGRRAAVNGKNEPAVKAVFQGVLGTASSATVRILADGEAVALGTVVDPSGYLVTKASVLGGKVVCRFKDGTEKEAKIVGEDTAHDLALLHVDRTDLSIISWRDGGPPPPGSLVATTSPGDAPVALGVVSTGLRRLGGPRNARRPQAWLGIGLGSGQAGTRVESVMPNSPAAKADIRVGDAIQKIDGKEMKSADQVVATVGSRAPKDTIKLSVRRQDQDVEISATLAKPQSLRLPEDEWGGGPFSERRSGFDAVLPHDTPLNPKDCGGPLVDTDGRAVGVNIARALRVTTYALTANDVRRVVEELRRKAQSPPKN